MDVLGDVSLELLYLAAALEFTPPLGARQQPETGRTHAAETGAHERVLCAAASAWTQHAGSKRVKILRKREILCKKQV